VRGGKEEGKGGKKGVFAINIYLTFVTGGRGEKEKPIFFSHLRRRDWGGGERRKKGRDYPSSLKFA